MKIGERWKYNYPKNIYFIVEIDEINNEQAYGKVIFNTKGSAWKAGSELIGLVIPHIGKTSYGWSLISNQDKPYV